MKFGAIKDEWKKDQEIDPTNVGNAALETVKITTKYLDILSKEKFRLKKMKEDHRQLEHDTREYFMKRDTKEVRERLGKTEGFAGKILKSEVRDFVDVENSVVDSRLLISAQEEKIDYLNSIIKLLNERNWAIKHYIDWQKFKNGGA